MVVLIGGILGVAGAAVALWGPIRDLFTSPAPRINTAIVMDVSETMAQPFGGPGGTKLTAAARSIQGYAKERDSEGLALLRAGTTCDAGAELVVDFGRDRASAIRQAAKDQSPGGSANLVDAIVDAIGELTDPDRFQGGGHKQRIAVFTSAGDDCDAEAAELKIRRAVEDTGIEVDFTFVGLAIPDDQRQQLRDLAAEFDDGEALFADTDEELGKVTRYIDVKPVLDDVDEVLGIHRDVNEEVNAFIAGLNGEKFDAAERALANARRRLDATTARFESLGERHDRQDLRDLHRLVGRSRKVQDQLLELGDRLLELARQSQDERQPKEYDNGIAEWNGLIARHNETVARSQERLDRLQARLPAVEH